MEEIWKEVVGYEGLYEVSNLGNVRSIDRKVQLKGKNQFTTFTTYKLFKGKDIAKAINKYGYYRTLLHKNGKKKNVLIHRLVAEAFIPNSFNKPTVNHIDGNTLNNCVNNLEWATMEEQVQHSIKVLGHKRFITDKCRKKQIELHQKKVQRSDGKIFNSIKEASNGDETLRRHISSVCKGYRNMAGGYGWCYYE